MCGRHKTCHRNGDHNRDKQTRFGRDSPLLINVTVTVNEVQVPPSQSLSQVGVDVILWTAHCTSYSVSWLYQSFLNYPNKLVHCIPMCHFCTCCIDSIISFILYVIFSIVVAQGLDNLPSRYASSIHSYYHMTLFLNCISTFSWRILKTLKPQKGVACLLEQFCGFRFIFGAKLKEEKAFHMRKKHNYTKWFLCQLEQNVFWFWNILAQYSSSALAIVAITSQKSCQNPVFHAIQLENFSLHQHIGLP